MNRYRVTSILVNATAGITIVLIARDIRKMIKEGRKTRQTIQDNSLSERVRLAKATARLCEEIRAGRFDETGWPAITESFEYYLIVSDPQE